MKKILFLIFLALNVLTLYSQNISAVSVVFVKGSVATSYAITPKMFDRDSLEEYRDTVILRDKKEISEIVETLKSLKLSDKKTLDVRGKITVYYDFPIKQIWVYWNDYNVAVGLNGMVYEMSVQFADMINRVLQENSRDAFFDSAWYRSFFHSALNEACQGNETNCQKGIWHK